jgi:dGTPase
MTKKMVWDLLLSEKRERPRPSTQPAKTEPFRNAFDMDYQRIVNSSSVRRLQDKAQVYPLQENDFTRTRLTHSLEVSSISRSMGDRIGFNLVDQNKMNEKQSRKLSSLLAVAGLVHDLGNPPFGHYGETIIRNWFSDNKLKLNKNKVDIFDYIYFDGNAQTIRIISRLQFLHDKYGMNFSYGTLATLLKYPWASNSQEAKNEGKIGFFVTEKGLIDDIVKETGMKASRAKTIKHHPATYLLEAADDIAYLFADLEDTLKKGYLPWPEVKCEILKITDVEKNLNKVRVDVEKASKINENGVIPSAECSAIEIMDFRVSCQSVCITEVCSEFLNNYDAIMKGEYNGSLLKNTNSIKMLIKKVREYCGKYAYSNNEVLSLELVGRSVLFSLLDKFIEAALDDKNFDDTKSANGKVFALVSENFKYIHMIDSQGHFVEKRLNKEERVRAVVDYISGMTDSFALNLHKKLAGIRLP